MKFYIVTPAFRALERLRGCIRSVADQVGEGVEVHHHVQDGGSADGTAEWMAEWQAAHADVPGYTFTWESCKDNGMYDAINRGWEKLPTDADITAHLNADEQYCPHALQQVAQEMLAHPKADILLGTYIILDKEGKYHCHRRPVRPFNWSSTTNCDIITCSCFHRVSTFMKHGIRCNTQYKAMADLVLFRDIVRTAPCILMRPQLITSGYTVTGSNLAWTEAALAECKRYFESLPRFFTYAHPFIYRCVNLRRRIVNYFCSQPRECAFYPLDGEKRVVQNIERPTCIWRNQWDRD